MKIGIMTLWATQHNYGAVLQCYALQEYLRKKGHSPYLIRYKAVKRKISVSKISAAKILTYLKRIMTELRKKNIKDEPRYFSEFIDRYMGQTEELFSSWEELSSNPPKADMYIAGSDQIWNFYDVPLALCKENIHAYFLDFGDSKIRRAAYAASWDKRYVTKEQLGEIKKLIKKFDYVSVREKTGLELCESCGITNAEWVPDPTLLLSAGDYRKLYSQEDIIIRKVQERYVLLYMVLSNNNTFDISSVYKFAAEKKLRVIYVAEDKTLNTYEKYYPTIQEWLYLMDNAEYVITNSFHGTVFSLIFQKQFGTIPLKGYVQATNARIQSLYDMFQIPDRFIIDYDFSILEKKYYPDFKVKENRFDKVIGGGFS